MNEHPEQFKLTSLDEDNRDIFLIIDYDTFLALGFDGYHAEDLRAFIRQAIEQDKIAVKHKYPRTWETPSTGE
jgi:hypothetical protein